MIRFMFLIMATVFIVQCASSGGGRSREGGFSKESSKPVNNKEVTLYKQAIIRCHKTGGSRIVKINGALRCF